MSESGAILFGVSSEPVKVAIALGSNLGDRRANIESALASIAAVGGVKLIARGPVLENPAVAIGGVDPGGVYLNTAAIVLTTLGPAAMLEALHEIEATHGRCRDGLPRGGPRTLDLDLVIFGRRTIASDALTVPHPRMHERRFVLEPLAAIAPDWTVPGTGKTISQMLFELGTRERGAAPSV